MCNKIKTGNTRQVRQRLWRKEQSDWVKGGRADPVSADAAPLLAVLNVMFPAMSVF